MWDRPLRASVQADTSSEVPSTLLQAIRDAGTLSRADLARMTGLSPAAVTANVQRLVADGLVGEGGTAPSTGGKPPTLIEISQRKQTVAVDLARTPMTAGLVDLNGNLIRRVEAAGRGSSVADVAALIAEVIEQGDTDIVGVGVATPGVVSRDGAIRRLTDTGWHSSDFAYELASRLQLPVRVCNDANAMAIAEYSNRGAAASSMAVLSIGLAIGAGIILDGRIHVGEGFTAGEIGCIRVVHEGGAIHDWCGRTGCLATVAALPAVFADAAEMTSDQRTERLAGLEHDERLIRSGRYLGRFVGQLAGVLDVPQIVIAGEIRSAGEEYLAAVSTAAQETVLPPMAERLHVSYAQVGREGGLLGAAAFARVTELGFL